MAPERLQWGMLLFGHIHKSHGTISDGVTVFSNAAIMDEGHDNLNIIFVTSRK